MVNDLHLWEIAWCDDLHALQTKVKYLIQIVEKPYFEYVPQFGQTQLDGRRDNFFTACSGEVGIVIDLSYSR